MTSPEEREAFIGALNASTLTQFQKILGLVWFDTNRDFHEVVITSIVADLVQRGMSTPNPSRLKESIKKSKYLIRGNASNTVRLSSRYATNLAAEYAPFSGGVIPPPKITNEYLPLSMLPSSRKYLIKLAEELNGCYHLQYYDGAAVLARRIIESLIIEVYVLAKRDSEIRGPQGGFLMLDKLITHLKNDASFSKGRNFIGYLEQIKSVGDTAAHDRVYITHKQDLDDIKFGVRRAVAELLKHCGLTP